MTNKIKHGLAALLAITLISACRQSELPGSYAQGGLAEGNKLVSAVNDPCVMVLVPSVIKAADTNSETDKLILRYQNAVAQTSEPLAQLERLGWAYVAKARETRDVGYYTLAEQAAACIEIQAPESADALLLRGHVLHNLHRFQEAEAAAQRLVEQRGLWFDFALLGDVLTERGDLQKAAIAYQQLAEQRPGPQAYLRISQLRWLKGDLEGALQMMVKTVRATSPRTPEPAAWAHVRLAMLLMQLDQLAEADAALDSALLLQPGYPPALYTRGRILLAQHRASDAISLLRQAVQADPLPEFRWALYEALKITGQYRSANQQLAELQRYGAIEDARTFALFLATRGEQPETALRLALDELQLRKDVFTLDAVAWALSSAGKHSQAREYSRQALAEGTQDARLFLHAGVIAARAGDNYQAFELLSSAESIQQMLLPSERQQLNNEFAALQPLIHTLVDS